MQALQQQVKDQQAALEKANLTGESGLPQNPEPSPIAGAEASPSPAASVASRFPTEDTSVVASTTAPAASPAAGCELSPLPGSFPTTDTSVVTSTPETISSTGAGASLTQPITIGGGKNYMNISLDSVFALAYSSAANLHDIEVGDHDPQQRGFNARNTELAFDGAVDPYFEGFANIVFKLDNDNETEVEVEEAFMQTTNLPFNLQLKGGQFFAAFGRINPTHPHTWDFADAPLVNGLFLGPDGLRGVGAQDSWTLPVPWYSQLIFRVAKRTRQTGFSFRNPGDNGMFFDRETTDREVRGLQDFVWIPRLENSFDLERHPDGAGGRFRRVRFERNRREFAHPDLRRRPSLQMEKLARRRRFPVCEMADRSDVSPFRSRPRRWMKLFRWRKRFTTGECIRRCCGDLKKAGSLAFAAITSTCRIRMFTDDLDRQSRWRLSANLTWYPTEFSKIRLQYNHDFLEENFFLSAREVDSVFLQFEFILGAHGAHKF